MERTHHEQIEDTELSRAHTEGEQETQPDLHCKHLDGLTLIFEPKGVSPLIDIILIHGLGGRSIRTWMKRIKRVWAPWQSDEYFWPEWLRNETSLESARIWTFGYPARDHFNFFKKSDASFEDFALRLLHALEGRDSKVSRKSIIIPYISAHLHAND